MSGGALDAATPRVPHERVTSRARHFVVVLALALAAPVAAAAQARTRGGAAHPDDVRDLLAGGVTYGVLLPEGTSPTAASDARPLLDEMAARLRALRNAPLQRGHARVLSARARALIARPLPPIELLARRAATRREVGATVEALALWAQAHEHVAEQLGRLEALVVLTPAERARFRRAEQAIARLERIAARIEAVGREIPQGTIDRDPRVIERYPADDALTQCEGSWDEAARAHRQVAVVLYATAVHLARAHNVMSALAWHAAERLHDEANRALLAQALGYQALFTPREGEFDARSPGAVLLEAAQVSGARLAR